MSNDLNVDIKISAKDETKKGTQSAKRGIFTLKKSVVSLITSLTALSAVSLATTLIKQFATLDTAIRKAAAVTGKFEDAFPKFEAAAKKMGETTQFTSLQAAESLQKLAQSGLDVERSIAALPIVLNLAAASGVDLSVSADTLTNIMAQYGFGVEDLTTVSDKLVKTFTSTNTGLGELGYAFTQVGSIAKSADQDFNDISATLGELANNGYKGEQGGTALRGGLARLLRPVRTVREELKKLQLDVFDEHGSMRPFLDIIQELSDKSATTTQLVKIFGVEAGPAMAALVSKGTQGIRELSAEIEVSGGLSKKVADDMQSGLGGTLALLESAYDAVKKSMGEALGGGANESSKTFISVLGRIKAPLTDLSKKAGDTFAWVVKAIDSFRGFDAVVAIVIALSKAMAFFAVVSIVKAVNSLAKYILATRFAAKETAQLAAANVAELRAEAALMAVRIKATQTLLAQTQHMAIKARLAGELSALNLALAKTETSLAAAQAGQTAATQAQTLSFKSLLSVTSLLNIAMAAFVGWEIGSFLRENSTAAEKFGIRIAEAGAKFALLFDSLFGDANFTEDLKTLKADFKDMYDSVGDESIKAKDKRVESAKTAKDVEVKAAEDLKKEVAANFAGLGDELKASTAIRQEIYQRDLSNLSLVEQEKLAKLGEFSQARFNIELANNQQALALAKEFSQKQLQETDLLFDAEIEHLKKLKFDTVELERSKTEAKKAILLEYEKTFASSIKSLISLEKKHRDKAISFQKEIQGIKQTHADRLRELDRIGLTDAQVTESKKKQLKEETAKVKKLIQEGEYAKAVELGKKTQSLAYEVATAEQAAYKKGEGSFSKAQTARTKYNSLIKLTTKAAESAGQEEVKLADTAKKSIEEQKKGLGDVQLKIKKINDLLLGVESLEILVEQDDIKEALKEIREIQKAAAEGATFKVNTEQGYEKGGLVSRLIPKFAKGDLVSNLIPKFAKGDKPKRGADYVRGAGTGTSDSILAWLSNTEFVMTAKATKKYGVDFLRSVNNLSFPKGGAADIPAFSAGDLVGSLPSLVSPSLLNVASSPVANQPFLNNPNIVESMAVDLSQNGESSIGIFPRDNATKRLIAELLRNKKVGR